MCGGHGRLAREQRVALAFNKSRERAPPVKLYGDYDQFATQCPLLQQAHECDILKFFFKLLDSALCRLDVHLGNEVGAPRGLRRRR